MIYTTMEEMMNYMRAAVKLHIVAEAASRELTVDGCLKVIDRVFDEKIAECTTIVADVTAIEKM